MDMNAIAAGYVIAAYGITAASIFALIAWCLLRDKAANAALQKLKD